MKQAKPFAWAAAVQREGLQGSLSLHDLLGLTENACYLVQARHSREPVFFAKSHF